MLKLLQTLMLMSLLTLTGCKTTRPPHLLNERAVYVLVKPITVEAGYLSFDTKTNGLLVIESDLSIPAGSRITGHRQ